jgi:hypothetical protein
MTEGEQPRGTDFPTVFAPAVWRRIAEAEGRPDAQFAAEYIERAKLDNAADATLRAELASLAAQLYDLLIDRTDRIAALWRLVPQASNEREAVACAGLTWADTGLPDAFEPCGQVWLPRQLSDARKLLTWLEEHPPTLPLADTTDSAS